MGYLRHLAITSMLVLAQSPETADILDKERVNALRGTDHNLLTLKAVYLDGTPAKKSFIGCEGSWYKHADEEQKEWSDTYMFKADSRGAVIFNPTYDITYFRCHAEDTEGKRGMVEITEDEISASMIKEITVR